MDEPAEEKHDKEFTITRLEMGRFTAYAFIFFIIAFLQLRIATRFISNSNIKDQFFANSTNIFKQDYIGRLEALEWVDKQLYRAYNLNSQTLGETFHEIVPITKLRVISSQVKRDSNTGLWDKNMKQVKENIGSRFQFTHKPAQNGYQVFFLPFSVLQHNIQKNGDDESNQGYVFNDLNLMEDEFLNSETQDIKIDASFYNGNINFVVVLQIEFMFTPQGQVTATVDMNSFIANAYLTEEDKFRMIMEILFLAFYANFCILEVLKLKAQLKRAFDDDAKIQIVALKKKEKADEKQKIKDDRMTSNMTDNNGNVKKREKDVLITINNLDLIQQKVQERIENIKKNLKLIALGLQRHVSDIWSALDVSALIIIGIGIQDWTLSTISATLFTYFDSNLSQSSDYYSYFLRPDIEQANQRCIDQSIHTKRYRKLVAISGLIMTTRLIKYFIFIFSQFSPYQLVILKVFQYMLSFMIILITMIFSLTQFFYFFYGSDIQDFSDFYSNLNYIFGMILGVNDNLNYVFEYDKTLTLVVQILFYLLIICIMLNMFYIFVICEFAEYESRVEAKIQKDLLDENKKIDNKELTYKHPIMYFYEASEYLFLQFWFTFICKRSQFDVYMDNKAQKQRLYEREFTVNHQIIGFDINFRSSNTEHNALSNGQKEGRFLLDEEKQLIVRKNKVELVQLIWRAVILLILLLLNFVLVQQFYSPSEAFNQGRSIQEKMMYGGTPDKNSVKFKDIKKMLQVTDWISDQFPQLFIEILIGKRELQGLYETPEPFFKDETQTPDEQLRSYMYDEFQFESLNIATSLNFFNLVINNQVRITIRKSNLITNPDINFRVLYPKVKTFFPLNPKDPYQPDSEQIKQFEILNGNISILQVDYSTNKGWANSGGYSLISDVQQTGHIIKNLVNLGFLDHTTSTITIEFLTVNPVNKGCLAYVVVYFVINQAGIVTTHGVDVRIIKQNSLKTIQEISIIFLTFILFIYLCYHFYKTINTMKTRYLSYQQWYETYIKLVMSKAQLHFRNRHTPEFMRKWFFLLDVPQILSFIYFALMALQISLIMLSFYEVDLLFQACDVFDDIYGDLFNLKLFNFGASKDYLATAQFIITISNLISMMASLAILVLCIEILYLLSNNQEFQILTKSIQYSFKHLPYVLIILFALILSFTIMAYLMMGPKQKDFSSLYSASLIMTSYIYDLDSMKIFRGVLTATEFFLIAFPFILVSRFIIVNQFFAIMYRAYQITKKQVNEQNQITNKESNLTIQEFLSLTLLMFRQKQRLPKPQSDLYMMQIMKQFNFKRVYSQIRENIRIQINMGNIRVWSSKCGLDIKEESEVREPIDKASDEILQAYIELNNQGDFEILGKLSIEPGHKIIQFALKMTYFEYYRQATQSFDKFISFFNHRIEHIEQNMYLHLQNLEDDKVQFLDDKQELALIGNLEQTLEDNQNNLLYIKQEVQNLGLDQNNQTNEQEKQDQSRLNNIQENQFIRGGLRKKTRKLTIEKKNVGIKFQDSGDSVQQSGDTEFQSPENQ